MFKNITKILLALLCVLMLASCGQSNTSSQEKPAETAAAPTDEQPVQDESESSEEQVSSNEPVITYAPTTVESDEVLDRITTSYYYLRLNPDERNVYDEILTGINAWRDTIDITPINRASFVRIMNIILIDQPDLLYVSPEYSFTTVGENNYVNSVSIVYSISKEDYDKIAEAYQTSVRNVESPRSAKKKQLPALNEIVRDLCNAYASTEDKKESAVTALEYLTTQGQNKKLNDFNIAKVANTLLHHAGVNSLIAFGDEKRITDGNLVVFDGNSAYLDINKFTWFNEVQINDNWYILDIPSQVVFNETSTLGLSSKSIAKDAAAIFLATNDRFYAGTHTFWPTNENLGILPNCNSYEFSPVYNSGLFIPSPDNKEADEEYLRKYIELFQKQHVEKTLKQNSQNPTDLIIFFENEELFDLYKATFDAATKKYDYNNKQIEDYVMSPYRQYLILKIEKMYCY